MEIIHSSKIHLMIGFDVVDMQTIEKDCAPFDVIQTIMILSHEIAAPDGIFCELSL